MKMKKLIAGIVATACLTIGLAGVSFGADTVKLAVVGAHSGDLASYGLPTVNAAKLAVAKVNAEGGVMGKQVELIVQDDQCKPELATNAATKVVSEGADVVLGHICSGATKAALGIYKDADIICMSPSATNTALTASGDYPNFFRTIASDDDQAIVEYEFVLNTLGAKTVAIIHDKGDYGKGFATLVKDYIEKSGKAEVVLFEGVTPGAVDYTAVVQKVRRAKPDCVVFGGYHPEASKIVTTMRKKRMKTPFLSEDGVKDDTFIKVARKYAEGVYATGPIDVSKNPIHLEAVEAHKKEFGSEPGAFFDNAYAAALALLNGIDKAGTTEFAAVKKALQTEFVETPLGRIKFDSKGDAEGVGFLMYQVRNGQFVEVE